MRFTKEQLNLENAITKEWLITNGIGGYASSTIIGTNTRKYHGLLVAPLTPPAQRYLMLSKVDESIIIDEEKYDLYTNICRNYISKGYKNQISFEKNYIPIFEYKIGKITITKAICMEYGKNTVGIYYKVESKENKSAKLTLAPIINFRDFHCINKDEYFNLRQIVNGTKVKMVLNDKPMHPMYMSVSEGQYNIHENDIFRKMFYTEEEKRGFDPEENHLVPGVYEIEIKSKQTKEISFVFSLEENIDELDVKQIIDNEVKRLNKYIDSTELIDNKKAKKTKKEKELLDIIQ